jgi:hypothetical protein
MEVHLGVLFVQKNFSQRMRPTGIFLIPTLMKRQMSWNKFQNLFNIVQSLRFNHNNCGYAILKKFKIHTHVIYIAMSSVPIER